jgi:hypothetical protein
MAQINFYFKYIFYLTEALINSRVTKLSKLPLEAVEALGGILMESKIPPKQLQREADEVY